MPPAFLIEEATLTGEGQSSPLAVGEANGLRQITLGITGIKEQQSLDIAVYGSPDGATWASKPLLAFGRKFYKGVSCIVFDPKAHPEVHFLQARWSVQRWGHWKDAAEFRVFVFVETLTK